MEKGLYSSESEAVLVGRWTVGNCRHYSSHSEAPEWFLLCVETEAQNQAVYH